MSVEHDATLRAIDPSRTSEPQLALDPMLETTRARAVLVTAQISRLMFGKRVGVLPSLAYDTVPVE
jgi:hypothetical protein